MPEDPKDWRTSEHRDELHDPSDPPNSLLTRETRNRALMSYVAPVVILFVVVGIALIYWANRPASMTLDNDRDNTIGTAGTEAPGGFDSVPNFDSTQDELRFRGGDTVRDAGIAGGTETVMDVEAVSSTEAGRRVRVQDVEIDTIDGNTLWVRQDGRRLAVVMTQGDPGVGAGDRVDIIGTTEARDERGIQIRASRIDPR